MATKQSTKKERRDVAQEVTDTIIKHLEQGVAPWRKPWNVGGLMPTSAATGKPYRGINALLLSLIAMEHNYSSNVWTTFDKAKEMGGSVKKGEKSTTVVFFTTINVEDKKKNDGSTKGVPIMKFFPVFNIDQTDGCEIPVKFQPKQVLVADSDILSVIDTVWSGYNNKPSLRWGGPQAFYDPSIDHIQLPPIESFISTEAYCETMFHEAVHSTGHKNRLDRFVKDGSPTMFGSENYAKEELVAELGSVMLMSSVGVTPPMTNSAAYVNGWLKALKNDKSLLISAANKAQKAVDHILSTFSSGDTDN